MGKRKTMHHRVGEYEALRAEGKTNAQIANMYGVSRQSVDQMMARYNVSQFRPLSEKQCVHGGLRLWLNENKCSLSELLRRVYGYNPGGCSKESWRGRMQGKIQLKKDEIDKLIDITGLSYDALFAEVENEQHETTARRLSGTNEGHPGRQH